MASLLVVEDEPHIASGLRFNLEAEGHTVAVVDTGELALQRLAADHDQYDCIVLDVMLPGVDGFDVLQWCKTQPELEDLVIVVLSGFNGSREVNQAYALGADAFIVKPCRDIDLLNLLRQFPDHWLQQMPPAKPPRPRLYSR